MRWSTGEAATAAGAEQGSRLAAELGLLPAVGRALWARGVRDAAAAQKTMQLVQKGIVLNSNPGQGLTYKFTGLNAIKPDMITEATRNARAAADRFAADSGSKVGPIRQANQGTFSISSADQGGDAGEGGEGGYMSDTSIMKKVRVVTSVEYYLEK